MMTGPNFVILCTVCNTAYSPSCSNALLDDTRALDVCIAGSESLRPGYCASSWAPSIKGHAEFPRRDALGALSRDCISQRKHTTP